MGMGMDNQLMISLERASTSCSSSSSFISASLFPPVPPFGLPGSYNQRLLIISVMRIRIRSDPLIFGLTDPDPKLISSGPDPNSTCNNGFIKLLSKYKPESSKFKLKSIVYKIQCYHPEPDPIFFPAEPDSDPMKKNRILTLGVYR